MSIPPLNLQPVSNGITSGDEEVFTPPLRSRASRFPRLRSKGSFRGSFVGGKPPRQIVFESKLECDIACVLLARPDVVDVLDQPPAVIYFDGGKKRKHTFDFLVHLTDGRRIAIAVKPYEKAVKNHLSEKLKLIAAQLHHSFATEVMLMTEQHVSRAIIHDAKLIHTASRLSDPVADSEIMAVAGNLFGDVTIDALVKTSGLGARGFGAVIRLIADGSLFMASEPPINYTTSVRLGKTSEGC